MRNQAFHALCIQDTENFDGTKILTSNLIYELTPMSSSVGTVGYEVMLDGEDMGKIRPEQFDTNFIKTTLTSLEELHKIDGNSEVIVWSEMPRAI